MAVPYDMMVNGLIIHKDESGRLILLRAMTSADCVAESETRKFLLPEEKVKLSQALTNEDFNNIVNATNILSLTIPPGTTLDSSPNGTLGKLIKDSINGKSSQIQAIEEAQDAHEKADNPHNITAAKIGASVTNHVHTASDISSTVPVEKGGTGKTSWIANRILYASSSVNIAQMQNPNSNQSILMQNTSGTPYWNSSIPASLISGLQSLIDVSSTKIECGTYTGNGNASAVVSLSGTPKAVLVFSPKYGFGNSGKNPVTGVEYHTVYGGLVTTAYPCIELNCPSVLSIPYTALKISGERFLVSFAAMNTNPTAPATYCGDPCVAGSLFEIFTNCSGYKYTYIAIF